MPYKDKTKQKQWYVDDKKKHPEKYLARTRRFQETKRRIRRFGAVDKEIVEAIWIAQDKCCAICKISIPFNAHMDHNHKTGKLRGMLCKNCNPGLGQFKENINTLLAAVEYLRKYNGQGDPEL